MNCWAHRQTDSQLFFLSLVILFDHEPFPIPAICQKCVDDRPKLFFALLKIWTTLSQGRPMCVRTLNGYDKNISWLNIVIKMQFPGSFAWPKGRESLPSLPKLTQGVKEMFPLCDGRSGVVKCSLAISLGRPGEPRVIGRSSKVSLKERMLGKIIVPKIFEKRWTIDATNPNMSKSLTFQHVRSHEVIFNRNRGIVSKSDPWVDTMDRIVLNPATPTVGVWMSAASLCSIAQ